MSRFDQTAFSLQCAPPVFTGHAQLLVQYSRSGLSNFINAASGTAVHMLGLHIMLLPQSFAPCECSRSNRLKRQSQSHCVLCGLVPHTSTWVLECWGAVALVFSVVVHSLALGSKLPQLHNCIHIHLDK